MFQRWRGKNKESGQSMVELAIFAPLLVLLLMIIIECGLMFATHMAVVGTAREGARLASRGGYYSDAEVTQVITNYSRSLNLSTDGAIVYWDISASGGNITSTNRVLFGSLNTAQNDIKYDEAWFRKAYLNAINADTTHRSYLSEDRFVVIEVFYDYKPFSYLLTQPMHMHEYAIMSMSAPS
jgi:Flp pilus assembly protein TadG